LAETLIYIECELKGGEEDALPSSLAQ